MPCRAAKTSRPPVFDAAILREMNPPLPLEQQAAFAELVALVTTHLPADLADKHRRSLRTRVRRGDTAGQVPCKWIAAHHGPKVRSLAQALLPQGRVLLAFDDDDAVGACTVARADEAMARARN